MAAKSKLSPHQEAFVLAWFELGHGTEAHKRAYPGGKWNDKTRAEAASRILALPKVVDRIAELRKPQTDLLTMTAAQVLHRWVAIATADPRELVEQRKGACRYCNGLDHAYQWRNDTEFYSALAEAAARNDKRKKGEPDIELPTDEGGYGYRTTNPANPDCPHCDGMGIPYTHIHDSRTLSPQAVMLLAGYKKTKDGIEVKMHDQTAVLRDLAKAMGMLVDKTKLEGVVGMVNTELTPEAAEAVARVVMDKY